MSVNSNNELFNELVQQLKRYSIFEGKAQLDKRIFYARNLETGKDSAYVGVIINQNSSLNVSIRFKNIDRITKTNPDTNEDIKTLSLEERPKEHHFRQKYIISTKKGILIFTQEILPLSYEDYFGISNTPFKKNTFSDKFTSGLKNEYNRSSAYLKELFNYSISEILRRFNVNSHKSTDKPDYCFSFSKTDLNIEFAGEKPINIIAVRLIPSKNELRFWIRHDSININDIEEMKFKPFDNGKVNSKSTSAYVNIKNKEEINIFLEQAIPKVVKLKIINTVTSENAEILNSITEKTNKELYDPIEIADLSIGYEEGNKKLTQHIIRERNQKNIKAAKFYHGYRCNICNFSFEEKYGVVGKEFIEAHHIIPLNEFDEAKEVNPKTDLITLCSNCHRMIHRNKNDALSIEELKKIIDEKKKNN